VEANDPASHWLRATKARLCQIDPELSEYIERLFRDEFKIAA
jgi:hypothetical protein